MEHRIVTLTEKKLVGLKMKMRLTDNKTGELWKNFMPKRKEIQNTVGIELYSMQVYPPMYFKEFEPTAEFVKWACVEVTDIDEIPAEMEEFSLSGGLYSVFLYKGAASEAKNAFQYIFGTWLPRSGYILDDRPHFELLGEKYKNNDPTSEEEIWIPIKPIMR